MFRLLCTCFCIVCFQTARADTLDLWQVWLDDSLIGSFTISDQVREVVLKDKHIRNASQLRVKYVSDHSSATHQCFFMDDDYQFSESEIVKGGEVMSMSLKPLAVSGPPVVPMFYDVYVETAQGSERKLFQLFQVRWE